MTRTTLDDAFGHHVWATLRLMDVCLGLPEDQLGTTVPGTYGSILDTMRHIVGADGSYLFVMTRGRVEPIDEDAMDLPALRATMAGFGPAWSALLASGPDPEQVLIRNREDGSSTSAPFSIRLAQALHHGTDHRSQICTALTTLGVEPPFIDAWDYGEQDGRVIDVPPPS